MSEVWIDITNEIADLSKQLKFLQVVHHDSITLQETMHAHQINDPKIDPKFDKIENFTISKLLEEDKIKLPGALSVVQVKNIYAQILRLQSLILKTYPLAQTIYTFTYLYDSKIWKDSSIIAPLVESINCLGNYIYNLHKQASSIKEDDIGISTFAFNKNIKSHEEVIQLFLKAEKQIELIMKSHKLEEEIKHHKELIAHMKLRRSIHSLCKLFGTIYDNKQQSKIDSELKSVKKRISELQTLLVKNNFEQLHVQGVFSNKIFITIRSHFGPRDYIHSTTNQQALDQLKNGLAQFDLFFPPPQNITDYSESLNRLSYKTINLWAKSYIKINLFQKEQYLLNTVFSETALINDIKQWQNLRQQVKNDQKFKYLIKVASPAILQILYRMVGRNSRWFWQISKCYEDSNYLIHIAVKNQLDTKWNQKNKSSFITSWFYNWNISSMIRQILWGFQENMYEISEYHYVACQLSYILQIHQKNSSTFLNKLDKSILQSFYDNSYGKNKKKKKMLTDTERKFFSSSIFKSGLHLYFKSFYRALFILISRKLIDNPFEDNLELRINNRFKIFKKILFMKKFDYAQYKKQFDSVVSEENQILQQVNSSLKSAKLIFNLFSQFEEEETFYKQKQQSAILQKLCVKLSLVVLTLKMKQPKKFLVRKEYPKYPQIHLS